MLKNRKKILRKCLVSLLSRKLFRPPSYCSCSYFLLVVVFDDLSRFSYFYVAALTSYFPCARSMFVPGELQVTDLVLFDDRSLLFQFLRYDSFCQFSWTERRIIVSHFLLFVVFVLCLSVSQIHFSCILR